MKSVTQSQVCTKCGIEKPMDDFANERRVKSGKTRQCKQCHYAEVDKFSKIRRERLRNRPPAELSPDVMRTCRVCFEDKPETEFYRNRTMIDGIHSSCKLCNNSKHKSWKVANKDKVKQQRRRSMKKTTPRASIETERITATGDTRRSTASPTNNSWRW